MQMRVKKVPQMGVSNSNGEAALVVGAALSSGGLGGALVTWCISADHEPLCMLGC